MPKVVLPKLVAKDIYEICHGLLQATLVNQELIHAGEGPLHVFLEPDQH